jgi:hypothetical protein
MRAARLSMKRLSVKKSSVPVEMAGSNIPHHDSLLAESIQWCSTSHFHFFHTFSWIFVAFSFPFSLWLGYLCLLPLCSPPLTAPTSISVCYPINEQVAAVDCESSSNLAQHVKDE